MFAGTALPWWLHSPGNQLETSLSNWAISNDRDTALYRLVCEALRLDAYHILLQSVSKYLQFCIPGSLFRIRLNSIWSLHSLHDLDKCIGTHYGDSSSEGNVFSLHTLTSGSQGHRATSAVQSLMSLFKTHSYNSGLVINYQNIRAGADLTQNVCGRQISYQPLSLLLLQNVHAPQWAAAMFNSGRRTTAHLYPVCF